MRQASVSQVMTRRLKMRNRWFTERPEVANSANIYICTFFERGGGGEEREVVPLHESLPG